MAKYDIIKKIVKTGEESILDTIEAADQIEAKKIAVQKFFNSINWIYEQVYVKRR